MSKGKLLKIYKQVLYWRVLYTIHQCKKDMGLHVRHACAVVIRIIFILLEILLSCGADISLSLWNVHGIWRFLPASLGSVLTPVLISFVTTMLSTALPWGGAVILLLTLTLSRVQVLCFSCSEKESLPSCGFFFGSPCPSLQEPCSQPLPTLL